MSKTQTFTRRLQAAIEADSRSRYALCKLSGIDQAAMSRFMANKAGLTTDTLDRLLPVLELELQHKTRTTSTRKGR